MKIIVLQGSHNRNGSTSILVEHFTRGAEESGHQVQRIDVAEKRINQCTGCNTCRNDGPCILSELRDDNHQIRKAILDADMLVFATPLYYYGMSAQLKTVIDRFYAYNSSINRKHLKSALLAAASNNEDWSYDALRSHYKAMVCYLNLDDEGMVLGKGCGTPDMTKKTIFPNNAYELGKNLR